MKEEEHKPKGDQKNVPLDKGKEEAKQRQNFMAAALQRKEALNKARMGNDIFGGPRILTPENTRRSASKVFDEVKRPESVNTNFRSAKLQRQGALDKARAGNDIFGTYADEPLIDLGHQIASAKEIFRRPQRQAELRCEVDGAELQ